MDTTQANTNVRYAGFWLRFVAAIIDSLVLQMAQFFMVMPVLAMMGVIASTGAMENDGELNPVFAMLYGTSVMMTIMVGIVMQWLYYALMESSLKQATLGKLALGLAVTDMNGGRVSFARATGRYFGKIVSSLILCIGYIMAGFTAKKQALHDMMAECLVIKRDGAL